MAINWKLLGVDAARLPCPPCNLELARGEVPFSGGMALDIADFVRMRAYDDNIDEHCLDKILKWVSTLQTYYDDMSAFGLAKRAKDAFGKVASATHLSRRGPYKSMLFLGH